MDGLNGFEAAKILRNEFSDENPRIIFLTIAEEYSKLGYGIGIWDYISKPTNRGHVFRVLDRAWNEIEENFCVFQTVNGLHRFDYGKLLYVESTYRRVMFFTDLGEYEARVPFAEVLGRLPAKLFCRVHRSYSVNLRHVVRHGNSTVHMPNGKAIPVGRTYGRDFMILFENFLRNANER
jgi:DNA-binding LytR/AlgR family response regulator